ncbi:beta-1,3-galactosyltransferase [Tritrichomonas foetus]|uniref:Beta-1,3-galactosyltransferase n=1 Tax=Tritrichomonas foetus TaxID=1144522 RepID=A0A1J4KVN4_9EUKA|nr:beta-1,3-galactosyltransferase [Tritrichomonas foetus]|eukprot:OHT13758.1 beta-1,3-galactosyltransferase [Tritrichomonas foetus]
MIKSISINSLFVSIVIPFFNREIYLNRSIYSCLKQTFHDVEVICVDDSSTDGSLKVVKTIQKQDHRIFYYEMKDHSGTNLVRYYGIHVARGQFTMQLDSDDEFTPTIVEKIYMLTKTYTVDIIQFDAVVFRSIKDVRKWNFRIPPFSSTNNSQLIRAVLENKIGWNLAFLCIRRTIYVKALKYLKPYIFGSIICIQEDRLHAHTCFIFCNFYYYLHFVGYIYYRDHYSAITNQSRCNGSGKARTILSKIYQNVLNVSYNKKF